ncbi:hypothetical protein P280DRAFT_516817 [Massarina eburnea CBS 473.64]|uniref:Xaa-Pro aminopeptidase n=1 Tax=Massarina eburnea CBS 473.64 TaxID=1395130 RepID=A0A6A6S3S8_9PLEO|nr:hypothetical protein P280DRAFT_516817 [Massarina eburnea CBS 473.64]
MPPPDAAKLADRLHHLKREEYWLHVEAEGPLEKYPAKHHARRVRDSLDVATGLIYLPGAPARDNEDSDMPAPFRQRRYFYYLSGCNEPDCHLTYDIQHDILALFIPRINPGRVIWNGRGSTPAEAMDKYDIDQVHYVDELQKELLEWQFRYRGSFYVLHQDQVPKRPSRSVDLDSTSLQPAMNRTRMIKDEHEINLIRKANDISSEAHKQVLANITKFKNEAQVEGLFMDVCISRQAKQQAYDPIAASGPNAGTLHYDANNEDFGDRQLMCLDAGCEFENYASDITRTFPLSSSWPSSEAENIYKLVQRMQETCIERLAPGVRYLDLHILAHQIAIDGLLQLGILQNGTKEEIYNAGTSRAFFPHGLGHHVGLEVHDVGQKELMSLHERNMNFEKAPSLYPEDFHLPVYDNDMCRAPTNPESPHLEEGMVVTVEPGIYFSSYALSHFYLPSPIHSKYINPEVVNKYLPVGGVRIEDDILITSKGYENLTTAPKGEAMLEIIRNTNVKWPFVSTSENNAPVRSPNIVDEEARFRAPGISKRMSEPRMKPISRASTTPVAKMGGGRSGDFDPFEGPSLFSGFEQLATVEKVERNSPVPSVEVNRRHDSLRTVCGNNSSDFVHLYTVLPQALGSQQMASVALGGKRGVRCPECCTVSEPMRSHTDSALTKNGNEHLSQTSNRSASTNQPKSPPADEKNRTSTNKREMQQIRPHLVPSFRKPETPTPLALGPHRHAEQELRNKANVNFGSIPAEGPQLRSVTFDSYLQQPQPSAQQHAPSSLNPWFASTAPSQRPLVQDVHSQIYCPEPSHRDPGPRGLSAAFDRERAARFHPSSGTRPLASHPSMPILRSSDQIQARDHHVPSSTNVPVNRHSSALHQPRTSIPPTTYPSRSDPHPRDISAARAQRTSHLPSQPARPQSLMANGSSNPWRDAADTAAAVVAAPLQALGYEEQVRMLRDQKMEELRRAMEMVWKVKEDVERTFGDALGGSGGNGRGDDMPKV